MNWAVVHCFLYIYNCSKKDCFLCFYSWFWVCFNVPVDWFSTQPVLYIKHFKHVYFDCCWHVIVTSASLVSIFNHPVSHRQLTCYLHSTLRQQMFTELLFWRRPEVNLACSWMTLICNTPVLSLSRVTWLPESLKWCMWKYFYEEIKHSLSELSAMCFSTSCRSFMTHY